MSINYIDGATISFLQSYSKDDPNVIPFSVEIANIYHAYRRCYSKDPFADVPVEKQDRDKLKAKFIEYFEADPWSHGVYGLVEDTISIKE